MIRATHISFFCDSRSCILWSLSITLFYSIIFPCLILIDPLSNFLLLNSIIFLSLSLTLFDSLAIYLVLYSILFLFFTLYVPVLLYSIVFLSLTLYFYLSIYIYFIRFSFFIDSILTIFNSILLSFFLFIFENLLSNHQYFLSFHLTLFLFLFFGASIVCFVLISQNFSDYLYLGAYAERRHFNLML